MIRSVLKGVGSALPARVVSNAELAEQVDTSDEWIRERTGIGQRHIAGDGETTGTLATEAARKALADAGIDPAEVDLIILATATPDQTFPATAATVQANLGCRRGGIAFDVAAVCSGFLYALTTADSMIRTGLARCAVVIGAETMSRLLDWEDRTTCVLFGDGAGAFVIRAEDVADDGPGILASRLHADGTHRELLFVDGGPSSTGTWAGSNPAIGTISTPKRSACSRQCAFKVRIPTWTSRLASPASMIRAKGEAWLRGLSSKLA